MVDADTVSRDEMLIDATGQRHHWPTVPRLVVLTSVMNYHASGSPDYVATSDRLSVEEAESLARDLTAALRLLTTGAFEQFAAVEYEMVPAGSSATIVRPNQIVVGRFRGRAPTREHHRVWRAQGTAGRRDRLRRGRARQRIRSRQFDETAAANPRTRPRPRFQSREVACLDHESKHRFGDDRSRPPGFNVRISTSKRPPHRITPHLA